MRRKSDRAASKKAKLSPEKPEKSRRIKTRRRKQSTSSDNDSVDETIQISEESESISENVKSLSPTKNLSEETPDQVWQVKTAESSGDSGEIKKLKICLTRPPSTPESGEKSPRYRRKLRATSSSETPGSEGSEEKKKRHRSKRLHRESKDESDKSDSQADVCSKEITPIERECIMAETSVSISENIDENDNTHLVLSPKVVNENNIETSCSVNESDNILANSCSTSDLNSVNESVERDNESIKVCDDTSLTEKNTERDKSSPELVENEFEVIKSKEQPNSADNDTPSDGNFSKEHNEADKKELTVCEEETIENQVSIHQEDESNKSRQVEVMSCIESNANSTCENVVEIIGNTLDDISESFRGHESNARQTNSFEDLKEVAENLIVGECKNEPALSINISRKRKWGSRSNRSNSQKSLTISTDVLKEIIPDVKPTEFEEVIEKRHHKKTDVKEKHDRPQLPKIVIDNREQVEQKKKDFITHTTKIENDVNLGHHRKISIVKENDVIARPPSPPKNKQSCILYITNLVRPFTLPQLKNLLQRTGKIAEDGFWIDNIKSRCYVKYDTEDQAVETRHALHGVTWPVSNPKTLHVDFSTQESLDKAKNNEDAENQKVSTIPGTVEDWLREQDLKRERGELEKPWEKKALMREWDVGKTEKDKEIRKEDRGPETRRRYSQERSPEPAKKFKRKEEEAPAKLLDDLFKKTKTTPCIYWLPLSAETIAVKEQQRRQHMAEYERRMQEMKRPHRRPHPHPH